MLMVTFSLKMAQSPRREELKFATEIYGAACVEMGLISLMPMLPVKRLVFQVYLC